MYCSVSGISVQSVEFVSIPLHFCKMMSHSVYCSVSGISVQCVEFVSIPCYISVKCPSHSVYCSVSGISVQSVEDALTALMEHALNVRPTQTSWLRTQADIYFGELIPLSIPCLSLQIR